MVIKLAYNKANPNLVFSIDTIKRIPLEGFGIVEYYSGSLEDTKANKVVSSNYKVQVMGFESNWTEVPKDLAGDGPNPETEEVTVTATTEQQVVNPTSGKVINKVTVNAVTSAIDSNIAAGNIKSGTTILGVAGSVVELSGETANVTPTTAEQIITPTTVNGLTSVTVAGVTSAIDANILAENIKAGVTILGVEGTYTGETEPDNEPAEEPIE